jgi:hypothetical protein
LELPEIVFVARLHYFFAFRAFDLKRLDSICELVDLLLLYVYLFGRCSPLEVFIHQKLLNSIAVKLDLGHSLQETIYSTTFTTFELFLEVRHYHFDILIAQKNLLLDYSIKLLEIR